MSKLRNLSDKAFFVFICVVLLVLFSFFKGWNIKFGGGSGDGSFGVHGQNGNQYPHQEQSPDSQEQNSATTVTQSSPEPPKIAKLFLGRRGVSDDQVTWHDAAQFADFIKQLKSQGIREVQYTLLPDSIERYEEKWVEELKKANIRGYIEAD